jgi:hypothetical protein
MTSLVSSFASSAESFILVGDGAYRILFFQFLATYLADCDPPFFRRRS